MQQPQVHLTKTLIYLHSLIPRSKSIQTVTNIRDCQKSLHLNQLPAFLIIRSAPSQANSQSDARIEAWAVHASPTFSCQGFSMHKHIKRRTSGHAHTHTYTYTSVSLIRAHRIIISIDCNYAKREQNK